jgi:hypothetical protein
MRDKIKRKNNLKGWFENCGGQDTCFQVKREKKRKEKKRKGMLAMHKRSSDYTRHTRWKRRWRPIKWRGTINFSSTGFSCTGRLMVNDAFNACISSFLCFFLNTALPSGLKYYYKKPSYNYKLALQFQCIHRHFLCFFFKNTTLFSWPKYYYKKTIIQLQISPSIKAFENLNPSYTIAKKIKCQKRPGLELNDFFFF